MSAQMNLGDFERDLSALSPAEREVYELVEDDELTRGEVAEETGRNYSTVTTLLHRARRKRGEQPRV